MNMWNRVNNIEIQVYSKRSHLVEITTTISHPVEDIANPSILGNKDH